jgi:small conductance mechanosensitive channel
MPDHLDLNHLLQTYLIPWGLRVALALLIVVIGRMIISSAISVIKSLLRKAGVDDTLVGFTTALLRYLLLTFVVIAALSQLGIDTTSMVALLGAAGLAVGLSLQGSLQNFAAGVLIIVLRPFSKGNFVEVSNSMGTVESINIFNTVLRTPDNRVVILPNSSIIGSAITNFSAMDTRRVDMVFSISYEDDLRKAKALLEEILAADERILKEPAPVVALSELGASSVDFICRPWVKASDFWPVKWEVTTQVKLRFDAAGLTIPYGQMDVHLHQAAPRTDQTADEASRLAS